MPEMPRVMAVVMAALVMVALVMAATPSMLLMKSARTPALRAERDPPHAQRFR